MRIDRLDLTRFGIFTDQQLDFSAPGTHVVLGRNEAGKTTALRSIDNLLFGFDLRSPYAFLHDLKELRLGALLRDGDELLEIVRLKRNKDALRDGSDQPIDEAVLARLLGGVDRSAYSRLFTINHEDIESGGQALLESEGELGAALFSASRGTTDLSRVLDELEAQAAEIFKSGGSKPKLNAAISRYKELLGTSRTLSTPAASVAKLTEETAVAAERLAATEQELTDLRRQVSLMERIKVVRPLLAERSDRLDKRDEILAEGVLAGPEVADLLAAAAGRRDDAAGLARTASAEITSLDDRLGEITVDEAVLGQESAIRDMQTDLGGHKQNVTDLPKRRAEAAELQRRLAVQIEELPPMCRPEAGQSVSLTVAERSAIRELSQRAHVLDTQLGDARDQCSKLRRALVKLQPATTSGDLAPDTVDLHAVIERVRKAGDLDAARDEKQAALELCVADAERSSSALGLGVAAESIDGVPVPSLETIREYREVLRDRAEDIARIESKIAEAEASGAALRSELDDLLETEEPPADADLTLAREHREAGWQLVRGVLIGEPPEPGLVMDWAEGHPLPDAYESAVGGADEIADRLRSEAGAVERRATLEQGVAKSDELLAALAEELAVASAAAAASDEGWRTLWDPTGVVPAQPAGMEEWHTRYLACAESSRQIRLHTSDLAVLDAAIARHRSDLVAALAPFRPSVSPDASLSALIDQASATAKEADDAKTKLEAAEQKQAEAAERLTEAEAAEEAAARALDEWQAGWGRAVAPLGLDAQARPAEADAVLDALVEVSKTVEQLATLRSRIDGIVERSDTFHASVFEVLRTVDGSEPDADSDPDPAIVAANLDRRLTAARGASTLRSTLLSQREEKDTALQAAALDGAEAEAQIATLVAAADVADETQLAAAALRRADHDEQESTIASLEKTLREQTGLTIAAIELEAGEAADLDPAVELARLRDAVPDREEQRKVETKAHLQLVQELEALDGSGAAAEALEEAQRVLAEVVSLSEEYVRVTVGRHLLDEQIATYRESNQGPLLARSSDLFSSLTMGGYRAIEADVDSKGKAVLLAITAAGTTKEVAVLSSGTRDQLYLALRLAALDQLIARQGPLPLILDDLFVHFDDDRTIEGLGVLDSFADRTQVVLFTHHRAVVDQALATIPTGRVHVHELAAAE
jgi:uncharacterized protein YhaN